MTAENLKALMELISIRENLVVLQNNLAPDGGIVQENTPDAHLWDAIIHVQRAIMALKS